MVRYSFPVRLFHSLLHAGLSRRSDRLRNPRICGGQFALNGLWSWFLTPQSSTCHGFDAQYELFAPKWAASSRGAAEEIVCALVLEPGFQEGFPLVAVKGLPPEVHVQEAGRVHTSYMCKGT